MSTKYLRINASGKQLILPEAAISWIQAYDAGHCGVQTRDGISLQLAVSADELLRRLTAEGGGVVDVNEFKEEQKPRVSFSLNQE